MKKKDKKNPDPSGSGRKKEVFQKLFCGDFAEDTFNVFHDFGIRHTTRVIVGDFIEQPLAPAAMRTDFLGIEQFRCKILIAPAATAFAFGKFQPHLIADENVFVQTLKRRFVIDEHGTAEKRFPEIDRLDIKFFKQVPERLVGKPRHFPQFLSGVFHSLLPAIYAQFFFSVHGGNFPLNTLCCFVDFDCGKDEKTKSKDIADDKCQSNTFLNGNFHFGAFFNFVVEYFLKLPPIWTICRVHFVPPFVVNDMLYPDGVKPNPET